MASTRWRVVLMAEILDFGYPQTSDIDSLQMYITTESIKSERAVLHPPPQKKHGR
jgi:AP-2 complex subunit mu-1